MLLKDKYYKKGWDDALYEILSIIQREDIEDIDDINWYIKQYLLKQTDPEDN